MKSFGMLKQVVHIVTAVHECSHGLNSCLLASAAVLTAPDTEEAPEGAATVRLEMHGGSLLTEWNGSITGGGAWWTHADASI
jgi:hypothetical protein